MNVVPRSVPDPVAGQHVAVVLGRARGGEQLRVERHAHRPVGRQRDQVGPLQRADARRLGKAQVVADQDAEAKAIGLDHRRRIRPWRGESVDPQERQVDLPVPIPAPVREQHQRDVEDLLARGLQRAAHDRDPMRLGQPGQHSLGGSFRAPGDRERLCQR